MNDPKYFEKEDGEYFADEGTSSIAPVDTWDLLSINQLIETKSQLEEKAWTFRNKPMIANVLQKSILGITKMIGDRSKL